MHSPPRAGCYNRDAMAMDVYARVAAYAERHRMFPADSPVVAGVSGGPDSVCMLDCLHAMGLRLVVAHLDHRLRPESAQEADWVRQLAESYALPAVVESTDVAALAREGHSLEEAGRTARYTFLVRVAIDSGAKVISVGHTQDDQAETVLMHFLRGAGAQGLQGMLPVSDMAAWPDGAGLRLARPMLEVARHETEAYCQALGKEPVRDPSNLDPSYYRNRLRLELLPQLEDYNPGIRPALARTAEIMRHLVEVVDEVVDRSWEQVARWAGDHALAVDVDAFVRLPIGVQREVARRAVTALRPKLRELSFDSTQVALDVLTAGEAAPTTLAGGLEARRVGEEVLIRVPGAAAVFPQVPQLVSPEPCPLPIPGGLDLAAGWSLEAIEERPSADRREDLQEAGHAWRAALDASKLEGELRVRGRHAGDRIRPLGMAGSMKLSDLFINRKIAEPLRHRWPLVVAGEKLAWVAGLHMADEFKLNGDTRRAVVLRLVGPDSPADR